MTSVGRFGFTSHSSKLLAFTMISCEASGLNHARKDRARGCWFDMDTEDSMFRDLCKRIMMTAFIATIVCGVWILGSWKSYLDSSRDELTMLGEATIDLERLAAAAAPASTMPSDLINAPSWGQATVSLSTSAHPDVPS
jgi:hypothetical protein